MPLDLTYMDATVRILGDVADTRTGMGVSRGPAGTGFLITVEGAKGYRHGYVVTAAHVLNRQTLIEVQAPDQESGGLHDPIHVTDWRRPLGPKVDIAVAPLDLEEVDGVYCALRFEKHLMPLATWEDKPWLGADMCYIGILAPLDRPMVRTGSFGALDQDGLNLEGGYEFPAHLVDCRSYGGFSGSPCYVQVEEPEMGPSPLAAPDRPLKWPTGRTLYYAYLVGMFTNHLTVTDADEAVNRYGVGVMLRWQEIAEALMADEFKADREEREAQLGRGPVQLSGAGARLKKEKVDMDERVSLYPLDPDDALRALLDTPPDPRS